MTDRTIKRLSVIFSVVAAGSALLAMPAVAQDYSTIRGTIDEVATVSRTGAATVSGDLTCSHTASVLVRMTIEQSGESVQQTNEFYCTPESGGTWSYSSSGFHPGRAEVTATFYGCFLPAGYQVPCIAGDPVSTSLLLRPTK